MAHRHSSEAGYSLLEISAALAVVAILCAVAIPAYSRNLRKARSGEATAELHKLRAASMAYIWDKGGNQQPASFPPTQILTPAQSCCAYPDGLCPANPADWDTPTWEKLGFSVRKPHRFRYEYQSDGSTADGGTARFTVRAVADLDCNGVIEGSDEVKEVSGEFVSGRTTSELTVPGDGSSPPGGEAESAGPPGESASGSSFNKVH
jgi:prepilin-type N-terminal cleavage/methylation domain-containing protein